MGIKYECDRCGMDDDIQIRRLEISAEYDVQTFQEHWPPLIYLCGFCHRQFRDWVKAGISRG